MTTSRPSRERPAFLGAAAAWQARLAWLVLIGATLMFLPGPMSGASAGMVDAAPITLACAALLSAGLLLARRRFDAYRWVVLGAAGLVLVLSILMLLPGIPPITDGIAAGTGLEFLFLAIGLGLSTAAGAGVRKIALVVASASAAASILPAVAYALDPVAARNSAFLSTMSPGIAVLLVGLSASLLLSFANEGWVRTLLIDSPGSSSARRLLPVAVLVPISLSYAGLQMIGDGRAYTGFHLSVVTVAVVATAVAVILWMATLENDRQAALDREVIQLRAIVESFDSAAVVMLDHNNRVVMTNRRARSMANGGATTEDWLFGSDTGFYTLTDRRPLTGAAHPVRQVLDEPNASPVSAGWTDHRGLEHALSFSLLRLPAEIPEQQLSMLSIEEQTESWRIRDALSQVEAPAAMGQLAWGIAHEMANVIGIAQISAESALLEKVSEKSTRNLKAVLQACQRGAALTQQLLEMTHEAGGRAETLDAVSTLHTVTDLTGRILPAHLTFTASLPEDPCPVHTTRAELEGAVLNLLANARNAIVEARRDTGDIKLTARRDDMMLTVTVEDDGPGIPPRLRDQVRNPYFTTRRALGGRGIGLTLVETFAKRSGGGFDLMPRVGGGTRAVLQIPLSTDPIPPAEQPAQSVDIDLSGYRLLLVENDPEFRLTLAEGLRAAGADVANAPGGMDALTWLANDPPPDVLITNVTLHDGVKGAALAERLLQREPEARTIFLSGSAEIYGPDITEQSELVLTKPVPLSELADAIRLLPSLKRNRT